MSDAALTFLFVIGGFAAVLLYIGLLVLLQMKRNMLKTLLLEKCQQTGIKLKISPEEGKLSCNNGPLRSVVACLTEGESLFFPVYRGEPVRILHTDVTGVKIPQTDLHAVEIDLEEDSYFYHSRDAKAWEEKLKKELE